MDIQAFTIKTLWADALGEAVWNVVYPYIATALEQQAARIKELEEVVEASETALGGSR